MIQGMVMAAAAMAVGVLSGTVARADDQAAADAQPPAPGLTPLRGQVILNPAPDLTLPSQIQMTQEALLGLEPGAGPVELEDMKPEALAGCPTPDGWQVVVVRGSRSPETVHGHLITIMPSGC